MNLQELVAISNEYGRDERYVLAGGGNTSLKDESFLYIKASGTTLATITEDGFVKMSRRGLAAIWEKEYPADNAAREQAVLADLMAARIPADSAMRPSVETSLHDLLPGKFVVHLHPALVNGLTCSQGASQKAEELFGKKVLWIDHSKPGYVLAKLVKEKLAAYEAENGGYPQFLLLRNHGIFVSADTTDGIRAVYAEVMEKLESVLLEKPDFSPVTYDAARAEAVQKDLASLGYESVKPTAGVTIAKLIESRAAFAPVASAFTPDHIVYCKAKPLFVEKNEDVKTAVEAFTKENGYRPLLIACEGLCVFACNENDKKAAVTQSLFCDSVKIATYAKSFGGYSHMPQDLIDFIANWEVESYRASVSK